MNNIDILEEMIKPIATRTFLFSDGRKEEKEIYNLERKQIEAIKTLIAENKEMKEEKREVISLCKKDLAFKKRLEKVKETIDDYNMGRFDTSESVLNILEG